MKKALICKHIWFLCTANTCAWRGLTWAEEIAKIIVGVIWHSPDTPFLSPAYACNVWGCCFFFFVTNYAKCLWSWAEMYSGFSQRAWGYWSPCLQASRMLRSHLLSLPGSNGRFWRAPRGPGPWRPPLLTVTARCLKAPAFLCPSGIVSGRGVVRVVTWLLLSESVYFKSVCPRSNERVRMMWWSLADSLHTKGVKVISACIVRYAALHIVVLWMFPFEIDRDERKWSCPQEGLSFSTWQGRG